MALAPLTVEHAGFQSTTNYRLTASLDHAGAYKEVLALEGGIAYAVGIALEVVGLGSEQWQGLDLALIEFLLQPPRPALASALVSAKQLSGKILSFSSTRARLNSW